MERDSQSVLNKIKRTMTEIEINIPLPSDNILKPMDASNAKSVVLLYETPSALNLNASRMLVIAPVKTIENWVWKLHRRFSHWASASPEAENTAAVQ